VNQTRLTHSSTFRLSAVFAATSVMTGLLLFALTYWQTKVFETKRISTFVATEQAIISHAPPDEIMRTVGARLANEYHLMTYSALFDPDGKPIVGNLRHMPADLPLDGRVHEIELREGDADSAPGTVIAAASRLADGKLLVIGRGEHVVSALTGIFASALLLGVIPTIGPALAAGIWLSRQTQRRVKAVNQSIERIMQGNVHERLPVHHVADDFDQLAARAC
jgi:hypothetical protein